MATVCVKGLTLIPFTYETHKPISVKKFVTVAC